MSKVKIWLDDLRTAPDQDWLHVYTVDECIQALQQNWGAVVEISFDHDLGTRDTGYDAICWLERAIIMDGYPAPPKVHVHTANLGAKGKMVQTAKNIMGLCPIKI